MILHNVAQVPQPSPQIHEGGDCFACAALAIARHFFPGAGIEVADAVAWFEDTYYKSDTKFINNSAPQVRAAFTNSELDVDVHVDLFVPRLDDHFQHGYPVFWPPAFDQRIEAYLAAGWLGYCGMAFEPRELGLGEPIPDKPHRRYKHDQDHMVVIDGHRSYWRRSAPGEAGIAHGVDELHVVCSVKGPYWIDSRDLVQLHGGTAIWWIRPRQHVHVDHDADPSDVLEA